MEGGRKKEEIAEDYCFICKDGGRLRICDYNDCLKAYHPSCIGKDDSFIDSGECWTCRCHSCFICHKSSNIQCFCCPSSVCRACIRVAEFVQLRETNGFCYCCLKLAILIEENADVDSDGGELNFKDAETYEVLFKDYWEIVKDQERLTMEDICTADTLLKKGVHCMSVSEPDQLPEEEGELKPTAEDINNNFNDDMQFLEDIKRSETMKKATLKRQRSNKRNFIGWGSVELIGFLTSIGKDTREPISQLDACEIIRNYVHANNLLHPDKKKKKVMCDEKLYYLFKKRSMKLLKIYNSLESHFAANVDLDDEPLFGSDEDDDLMVCKRQKGMICDFQNHRLQQSNNEENVFESPKSCYVSMVDKNIKSVYLRKSLVLEFLKNPKSFEGKVVGCFVRVKSDPKDFHYSPNKIYQLAQVTSIKKALEVYKIGEMTTDIVLRVSNMFKDIRISMLSDDDFKEEECEDLRQLVKKGLFKRPTVEELEEKIRSIHEDIMSHWIKREIATLQRQIDRANEKGWIREKFEYIERRELLRTDTEQTRLLKDIPKVIPDTEEIMGIPNCQLHSQRENAGIEAASPDKVVKGRDEVSSAGEEQYRSANMKESCRDTENIKLDVDLGIDPSRDKEPPKVLIIDLDDDADLNSSAVLETLFSKAVEKSNASREMPETVGEIEQIWYYMDPSGKVQGPFAMTSLRYWRYGGFFDDDFRVWKAGQSREDAILLTEALLLTNRGT